jgi:hypothetical protein
MEKMYKDSPEVAVQQLSTSFLSNTARFVPLVRFTARFCTQKKKDTGHNEP